VEVTMSDIEMWWCVNMLRTCEGMRARIGSPFKARNWEELACGLKKLPWKAYISPLHYPKIRVSSVKSALYHTGAVQERVNNFLHTYLGQNINNTSAHNGDHNNKDVAQSVFVRLWHDDLQVSIDIVHEEHYKRIGNKHVAEAPLRENMSAALLLKAGFVPKRNLWDPFMGSGSFLLEALGMSVSGPSSLVDPRLRKFSFQMWPTHDDNKYSKFIDLLPRSAMIRSVSTEAAIFGSDKDPRAVAAAIHNLSVFQESGHDVSQFVRVFQGDFMVVEKQIPKGKDIMIITNVPYGKRILPDTDKAGRLVLWDVYKRFGQLLQRRSGKIVNWGSVRNEVTKGYADIKDVFVLSGNKNFKTVSGVQWEVCLQFTNKGLPVEFLRLKR